ncbi:DNA-binding protein [Sinorhizobium meliloti]|uniref:helix-turn-helix transcriptional regulator n=1 Tax=Rhizobium meliloti TaxID=382 RepID=UPI00299DCFA2|nr:DNA-binding protein [Sinorhizobium meliloti]MDW9997114.1 DNA-binding protein [Sinorhizobium meliloti]
MGATLRELSLPRFALRRDEAAASLAISPSLFDIWIKEGRMPKGRKIGGVMLWDTEEIRHAWQHLADIGDTADEDENPYDRVVA